MVRQCACVYLCVSEREKASGGRGCSTVSLLFASGYCLLFAIKNGVYLTNPYACTYIRCMRFIHLFITVILAKF